jgi:hypothetical protein
VRDALIKWKFKADGDKYVGEVEVNFTLKKSRVASGDEGPRAQSAWGSEQSRVNSGGRRSTFHFA